jgi:hypothetical protein
MQLDFADDLRGPDPDDRFPAWLISLIAAAIICGAVMWWVV